MATRAERASSFGSIAAEYDRLRPSPAPDAVDWLVPRPCEVAVDLAAGTGLLTRELVSRADHVIAVEPDDRMREVLAARTPDVEVVKGAGEAIPLPDASVDALFVASAWHWLDTERAIPEIARVLKDGGRLGVLWTSRDRTVDWVRNLDRLPNEPQWDLVKGEDIKRWREASLPSGDPFQHIDRTHFGYSRSMSPEEIVELSTTYSALITATPEDRAAVVARTRETLAAEFPGATTIEFPIRSWCFRADRMAR